MEQSPIPRHADATDRTAARKSLAAAANQSDADRQPIGYTLTGNAALPAHFDPNGLSSRADWGIVHVDVDRHVLFANEAWCALIGRAAADIVGLAIDDAMLADDVEHSRARFAAHLPGAESYRIKERFVRPDGTIVWGASHISFVTDASGAALSAIAVTHDVTEQMRALEELRESEEHYRYTVEHNPQISWTADPHGAIDTVSSRWFEVTGIAPSDALGERWIAALHPDDIGPTLAAWGVALATKHPADVEYRIRQVDGGYRWFRARANPRLDAQGELVRWYGTLEDVDDRKRAENALRDSEERFRLAAEATGLGIWDFDIANGVSRLSGELRRMLGVPDDSEPTSADALACVVPEDGHLVAPLFDAIAAGDANASFQATFRIHRADDGRERWMSTGGWRTFTEGGALSRVLVTVRDITEERSAEERVRWLALHDPLTGLPNRACFNELLAAALTKAEAEGGRLALLLLDVDRLKETNDLIGHDAGDELLRTLARRTREAIGGRGTVARLGGDEFAMLLSGADADEVRAIMARLMPLLREPFTVHGYTLDSQATAGAALYPEHGTTAADLLKAADVALYKGKAGERGRLSIFEAEMRADLQRRASSLRAARTIVQENLAVPFYQPKIALADGAIVGFEALLRWQHSRMGLQGPAAIGAAFEDVDLATGLGDRMLDRVVEDMRRWLEQGCDFGRIAFNLSPAEFRSGDLEQRILTRLRDAGIPPSRLELEITESVFLGPGAGAVSATLQAFHDTGISIALDDFGTGYASLTHLKSFPVDVIKIDRGFVASLTTAAGDAAIVKAVIGLGRDLGMDVVAEGVETEAQALRLRELGCSFAQGYLFGRAMSADAASDLLTGARVREATARHG